MGCKNKEYNNKREDRARPDEDEDAKEDKERVPDGKGNAFRNLDRLVDALKKGHFSLFYSKCKGLCMRINKIERHSKSKEVRPDIKHRKSIPQHSVAETRRPKQTTQTKKW